MKRLPVALVSFLETLPDDTCKIVLHTNRKGQWEVEAFSRHTFREEALGWVSELPVLPRQVRESPPFKKRHS